MGRIRRVLMDEYIIIIFADHTGEMSQDQVDAGTKTHQIEVGVLLAVVQEPLEEAGDLWMEDGLLLGDIRTEHLDTFPLKS